MRARPRSRQLSMNASTSGRPCIRQRVSCALQNRFLALSTHNEQNGSPQMVRSAGSAASAVLAQTAGSVCPLVVQALRCRMHRPSPLLP